MNDFIEIALGVVARNITTRTKSLAPVDTGWLRDSYMWEREGKITIIIGTSVNYAVHQEYGTRYQRGTPHLRPAVEAELPKIPQVFKQEFEAWK